MKPIKVDCVYEERTSSKDNSKTYKAIFIKIADNYEKVVFLTVPEQALLEKYLEDNETVNPYNY